MPCIGGGRGSAIDSGLRPFRWPTHCGKLSPSHPSVLSARGNIDATRNRDGFKTWLADRFAKGTGYDQIVRDQILAEQDGSELFHVQFRNADEAVAVSRIFLGTQLQCARCHDHP